MEDSFPMKGVGGVIRLFCSDSWNCVIIVAMPDSWDAWRRDERGGRGGTEGWGGMGEVEWEGRGEKGEEREGVGRRCWLGQVYDSIA